MHAHTRNHKDRECNAAPCNEAQSWARQHSAVQRAAQHNAWHRVALHHAVPNQTEPRTLLRTRAYWPADPV
eukprot:14470856-Alexandrium_andersonii.AAC.1